MEPSNTHASAWDVDHAKIEGQKFSHAILNACNDYGLALRRGGCDCTPAIAGTIVGDDDEAAIRVTHEPDCPLAPASWDGVRAATGTLVTRVAPREGRVWTRCRITARQT